MNHHVREGADPVLVALLLLRSHQLEFLVVACRRHFIEQEAGGDSAGAEEDETPKNVMEMDEAREGLVDASSHLAR